MGLLYGNACDVNEVDLSRYFLADEKTSIVAAYIEGVRAGTSFFEAVQKLAAAKPTVIWKAGLSPGGARAAASHTGSLAGSEDAWTAFFKQTGAVRAFSLEELLDTISAFHLLPATRDDRVAAICGAGGFGVAASDACYRAGLTLAAFDEATRLKLGSILPPTASGPGNPVDCVNPFPRPSMLKDILEIVAGSGNVGSIVIDKVTMSVTMRKLLGHDRLAVRPDESWLEELPVYIRSKYKIPVLVVIHEGGEPLEKLSRESEKRRLRKYYHENGVAVYPTTQRAFDALGKMIRYHQRMGQDNDR
jgi:acyl-CoA synthetase (NDP forming)